jgi:hypothetical protein
MALEAKIQTLIDKQDSIEIVRDRIGALLKIESVNQMAIATAASRDPEQWDLRVFTECFRIIEQYLNADDDLYPVPLVCVSTQGANLDESKSTAVGRTVYRGRFAVDCYAAGHSQADGVDKHIPGDLDAALNRDRAARLVRNILMATDNRKLQLEDIVWGNLIVKGYDFPEPTVEAHSTQDVRAVRFLVEVVYNETAPQPVAGTLEDARIDIRRDEITGEIIAQARYDYLAP